MLDTLEMPPSAAMATLDISEVARALGPATPTWRWHSTDRHGTSDSHQTQTGSLATSFASTFDTRDVQVLLDCKRSTALFGSWPPSGPRTSNQHKPALRLLACAVNHWFVSVAYLAEAKLKFCTRIASVCQVLHAAQQQAPSGHHHKPSAALTSASDVMLPRS